MDFLFFILGMLFAIMGIPLIEMSVDLIRSKYELQVMKDNLTKAELGETLQPPEPQAAIGFRIEEEDE